MVYWSNASFLAKRFLKYLDSYFELFSRSVCIQLASQQIVKSHSIHVNGSLLFSIHVNGQGYIFETTLIYITAKTQQDILNDGWLENVTTNNFTFLKYPCIQNSPLFQFDKLEMAFFPLWMKCPIQIFSAQQVICLPDCKHSPCQLFRQNWQIWSPNTWHLDFLFFCQKYIILMKK